MKSFILLFIYGALAFAQSPVPDGAEVEKIAGNFRFIEGPVWKDSIGLLFSDMPANTIYKWTPDSGITVFMNPSQVSNGLTYDLQGRLIMAQTGLRRVARLEFNGKQTPLASEYDGKKLNSPNDLAVKSDGAIFFTDPPFNIPGGIENQELSFAGIYRISTNGELQLLDFSLELPNGICFSPDESKLYVNNSKARIIYIWDVEDDSTITNKREFARINPAGYADGMKVDDEGNLFCTGPLGVWIFSPEGTLIDTILVPENPTNCNWGDADGKTLYITGQNSLYKINLTEPADVDDQGNLINDFELYQNYPNPFNPETEIKWQQAKGSNITIKVYDFLGKEIKTLIDKYIDKGNHNIKFDASELSSGIYFFALNIEDFSKVKKMVYLK